MYVCLSVCSKVVLVGLLCVDVWMDVLSNRNLWLIMLNELYDVFWRSTCMGCLGIMCECKVVWW